MKDRHYIEFLIHLVGYISNIEDLIKEMQDTPERWDSFDECVKQLVHEYDYRWGVTLRVGDDE